MNTPLTSLVATMALSLGLAVSSQAAPVAKPAPRLVVVISIDQFSSNLFTQHRPEFTGGLGKLAREGVVYPNGYQSHAMTETCPGHSTLLTGKHPNKTGISANDWYDASQGKQVYCLGDDSVTLAHDAKGRAVSPRNMVATTYGDWLKAVSPTSRVFGVSGKDRGAITMAGHKADGAFWLQPGFGFTTYVPPGDTAEARLKPVAAFNARMLADLKKHPFKVGVYAAAAVIIIASKGGMLFYLFSLFIMYGIGRYCVRFIKQHTGAAADEPAVGENEEATSVDL